MKKIIAAALGGGVAVLFLAGGTAFAGDMSYQSSAGMHATSNSNSSMNVTNTNNMSMSMSTTTNSSGQTTTTRQSSATVTIQNFAFSPQGLSVPVGTTVTWTNQDNTAHTVTADSSSGPMSSMLQPGESFTFTFSTVGNFPYHCSIHPEMTASVTVTPVNQSANGSGSTTGQSQNVNTTTTMAGSTPAMTPGTASTALPARLPNTGAGDTIAVFAVTVAAGTVLRYWYLRRKLLQHF